MTTTYKKNYAYRIENELEGFIVLVDIGEEFYEQTLQKAKAKLPDSTCTFVGVVYEPEEYNLAFTY